jgi:hypothetical protein
MLAVLDGVRSIHETSENAGRLELKYTIGSESTLINDPRGEFLHDLIAAEVPPP